ncbi:hypothetical protein PsB1_1034 [Candidatus Phycosocius spiralis]|uniref:Uncharacterized protein n=1 Tax=Candidatus Phycosocius spiralis TaxID=2815099 RepID=A0ABQ4PV58_9PROT|nr:hypothetical protein PsB1_1034 [Candidatus Phycosocius spiralis]
MEKQEIGSSSHWSIDWHGALTMRAPYTIALAMHLRVFSLSLLREMNNQC